MKATPEQEEWIHAFDRDRDRDRDQEEGRKEMPSIMTTMEHELVIDRDRDAGDIIVAAANGALSCSCGSAVWVDVLTPVCVAAKVTLGPPDTSARARVETIYPGHRGRTDERVEDVVRAAAESVIDPTRLGANAYDCSCGGPVDFDQDTWRWYCVEERRPLGGC